MCKDSFCTKDAIVVVPDLDEQDGTLRCMHNNWNVSAFRKGFGILKRLLRFPERRLRTLLRLTCQVGL